MSDPTSEALSMLERLWPVDPWTHSYEGLDDGCLFCGSEHSGYQRPYEHYPNCPWMATAAYLGKETPNHVFYEPPDNPYRDKCKWCDWDDSGEDHEKYHDEWYPNDPPSGPRFPNASQRPIMDSFPIFQAPRGGISFFPPPDLSGDPS